MTAPGQLSRLCNERYIRAESPIDLDGMLLCLFTSTRSPLYIHSLYQSFCRPQRRRLGI